MIKDAIGLKDIVDRVDNYGMMFDKNLVVIVTPLMNLEDRQYIFREIHRLVMVESIAFRIEGQTSEEEVKKAFLSLQYMRDLKQLEIEVQDYQLGEMELANTFRIISKLGCKLELLSVNVLSASSIGFNKCIDKLLEC